MNKARVPGKRLFHLLILGILISLSACTKGRLTGAFSDLEGQWKWAFTVHSELLDGPESPPTLDTTLANSDYQVEMLRRGRICVREDGDRINRHRILQIELRDKVQGWQWYRLQLAGQENDMFLAVKGDSLKNPFWPCADGSSIPCDQPANGSFDKYFLRQD